jgi:hypothetical protein
MLIIELKFSGKHIYFSSGGTFDGRIVEICRHCQSVSDWGVQCRRDAKKLMRYLYFHQQLMWIGCGQLPARADWELKLGIGRHAYEDAMAASSLRDRLTKLRVTETRLGKEPDPMIELLFEEVLHASSDLEYTLLIYGYVKPELLRIYREHSRATQQIADQPTVRMLRSIIWDLEEQVEWGEKMIAHLRTKESLSEEQEQFIDWVKKVERLAGGFDGEGERSHSYPQPRRSGAPYELSRYTVRDAIMGPSVYYRTGMGVEYRRMRSCSPTRVWSYRSARLT